MAHLDEKLLISKVQLPGSTDIYEIHDASAIHSVSDLGLDVLTFKGVKASYVELAAETGAKTGDVWFVEGDAEANLDGEYVYANGAWEKLGSIHSHKHEASVTGVNQPSAVEVTVPVPDVSSATTKLSATASTSIEAPALTPSKDSVLGAGTKFSGANGLGTVSKTGLDVEVSNVSVAGNGTAAAITGFGNHATGSFVSSVSAENVNVVTSVTPGKAQALTGVEISATAKAITGFGAHTTADAITGLSTGKVTGVSGNSAVSIPNVTENKKVNASKVTANSVVIGATVNNGVLSFSFGDSCNVENVEASNVTLGAAIEASKVTTEEATFVTGSSSTAAAITALGVATTADAATAITPSAADFVNSVGATNADVVGTISSSSSDAITGLGTATTTDVLTGVKVSAQPTVTIVSVAEGAGDVDIVSGVAAATMEVVADTSDLVDAVIGVTAAAPAATTTVTLAEGATGDVEVVDSVTVGAKAVSGSGTAAAQTWSGSVSVDTWTSNE